MDNNIKWTCLYKTSSKFEAEAMKGNLESANVPCVILNKQDSSYLSFGYVEVHVPEDQIEKANTIINNNESDIQNN